MGISRFKSIFSKNAGIGPDAEKGVTLIMSPAAGTIVPLSEVADEAFSTGILGKGVAIRPIDGRLFAPAAGEIQSVADTGHALGMLCAAGVELLLHVGIDTVNLKGRGFQMLVKHGARVRPGDLLMQFDIGIIQAAGLDPVIMVTVPNCDDYKDIVITGQATVNPNDRLIDIFS